MKSPTRIKKDLYGRIVYIGNKQYHTDIVYHDDFTDRILSKDTSYVSGQRLFEQMDTRGRLVKLVKSVNGKTFIDLNYRYRFYKGKWFCKCTGLFNGRIITLNSVVEESNASPISFFNNREGVI